LEKIVGNSNQSPKRSAKNQRAKFKKRKKDENLILLKFWRSERHTKTKEDFSRSGVSGHIPKCREPVTYFFQNKTKNS
jgi:hypothetical protein